MPQSSHLRAFWAGSRWCAGPTRRLMRINQELEEMRLARVAEAARASEIKTLRRDPVTGAYRPG